MQKKDRRATFSMIPGFRLCIQAVMLAVPKITLDLLSTESPYQSLQINRSSYDHPMIPNTLSGLVPFRDMLHKLPDSIPNITMGSQNWRRPSPNSGNQMWHVGWLFRMQWIF